MPEPTPVTAISASTDFLLWFHKLFFQKRAFVEIFNQRCAAFGLNPLPASVYVLEQECLYPNTPDSCLQKLRGYDLRLKVHTVDELNQKCVRYLSFAGSTSIKAVPNAYKEGISGFFVKPGALNALLLNNCGLLDRVPHAWQL